MKILNISAPFISSPLNYIHNISISTGTFPSSLKYSLFKTGDKNNMANYRPIWLLTSSSKVLKQVIYKRVLTHINPWNAKLNLICHLLAFIGAHHILHVSRIRVNYHNILVTEQFGCRWISSTENTSYDLICEILKDSNNKRIVGDIFRQKNFWLFNLSILSSKLEFYGIMEKAYTLIKLYLDSRQQRVMFTNEFSNNNMCSNWSIVKHGVPQGSIMVKR